ncbi:MAG: hypothetical protein ACTSXD_01480, partial [Candidatus Heimdallarchaeaceae archaeon]
SFELLKLGYNYSIYGQREPRVHRKRSDWLHVAVYCNDSRVEQFIEEVFLSEVGFKGDCLIAMWMKNPKKAQYWLTLIHEYDPLFKILNFQRSVLTKQLLTQFNCQEKELFSRIYLSDEESKAKNLEKDVHRVLTTERKFEQLVKADGSKSKLSHNTMLEIRDQRELLISSNELTEKQADLIFNALWESNISLENPPTEILERTPRKVFVGHKDEDSGWGVEYFDEVNQLLKLLPMLSQASLDKIEILFDYLPFWMNLYRPLDEAMFKFKSEKVISAWKSFLEIDLVFGDKRNSWAIGIRNNRTQPSVVDSLFGLERVRELKDKDLLISLVNHHAGQVREKVQQLLKESL